MSCSLCRLLWLMSSMEVQELVELVVDLKHPRIVDGPLWCPPAVLAIRWPSPLSRQAADPNYHLDLATVADWLESMTLTLAMIGLGLMICWVCRPW